MGEPVVSAFETLMDNTLLAETRAQKAQVAKAAKQFDMVPKRIKEIVGAVDPSGRSSYGDWIIKQWLSDNLNLPNDTDYTRRVLASWHELKKRDWTARADQQLTTKRYPDLDSVVEVLGKYINRLPAEFQIEGIGVEKEKEKVAEPTFPFIAYYLNDFDEAKPLLNRSTWGRKDQQPAGHVQHLDDIHSHREGSWCIRGQSYWDNLISDTQGFVLMMRAEPRMLLRGIVPDPEDVIRAYEADELSNPPDWVEDEEMREFARNRYADGRLVSDGLPYTAIYILQLHDDESVELWDLADKNSTEDSALAVMQQFGSVAEQIEAIKRAVAGEQGAQARSESFIEDVYISPEAEARREQWAEHVDGRTIDVGDMMEHPYSPKTKANLRYMMSSYKDVPGVDVTGREDEPSIEVNINTEDERVWQTLEQIKAGESLAPALEMELARDLVVDNFIMSHLDKKNREGLWTQQAANVLYDLSDKRQLPSDKMVKPIANKWFQAGGKVSEMNWLAMFERVMERLGADWEVDEDGDVSLQGATFEDIVKNVTLEDMWFVDQPGAEAAHAQQAQSQQLLAPIAYKHPGAEQWPQAAAIESQQFERLIEKEIDKAGKEDSKKKKADKRTAAEKDRQENIYQWFAGLPMRPMPEKADFKRSLEFFSRHAFSNEVKIAEINRKKKVAQIVADKTSGVKPEDVDYLRKHLLSRGFKIKPTKPWARDEYVRMKLLRVSQELLAPIAPAATQFLPPEAGEHFRPEESVSSVEALLERVPMFKGEPRMGPRAGDAFVDAVDLELQRMTGETLGTWIEKLSSIGITPKAVLLGLDYAFKKNYSSAETATFLIMKATGGEGASTTVSFGESAVGTFERMVEGNTIERMLTEASVGQRRALLEAILELQQAPPRPTQRRRGRWNPKALGQSAPSAKGLGTSFLSGEPGLTEPQQQSQPSGAAEQADVMVGGERWKRFQQQQQAAKQRMWQAGQEAPPRKDAAAQREVDTRETRLMRWYYTAAGKQDAFDRMLDKNPEGWIPYWKKAGGEEKILQYLSNPQALAKVVQSVNMSPERTKALLATLPRPEFGEEGSAVAADTAASYFSRERQAYGPSGRSRPSAQAQTAVPRQESVMKTFEDMVEGQAQEDKTPVLTEDHAGKDKGTLVEFSTPERQSAILWARGFPVKRTTPKTVLWFQENEAYAWLDKIAEVDRESKTAKVLTPRVTSNLTGRQIKMVENALRCTMYAVEFVNSW